MSSDAIKFTSDDEINFRDGSTLWLERAVDGLIASRAFGAPASWLTLCQADRLVFEGAVVDMTDAGWIGVIVSEPACLLVLRGSFSEPEVSLRLPLVREPSGDSAFRTLDFYVAGDFVVAETEMVIVVLDRSGVLQYAIPSAWPQTRIQALDDERIELANEWGTRAFGLASGPALIAPLETDRS